MPENKEIDDFFEVLMSNYTTEYSYQKIKKIECYFQII